MELETIMLIEISETQKTVFFPYVWRMCGDLNVERLELKRAWRLGGEERTHWKIGTGAWTHFNKVIACPEIW